MKRNQRERAWDHPPVGFSILVPATQSEGAEDTIGVKVFHLKSLGNSMLVNA